MAEETLSAIPWQNTQLDCLPSPLKFTQCPKEIAEIIFLLFFFVLLFPFLYYLFFFFHIFFLFSLFLLLGSFYLNKPKMQVAGASSCWFLYPDKEWDHQAKPA